MIGPPSTLQIGHLTFTVEFDNEHCEDHQATAGSNGNREFIKLKGSLPLRTTQESLLHEILHMAVFTSGIDADKLGQHGESGWDIEEALIRSISMLLYGVLRSNPDLVAYLTMEEE